MRELEEEIEALAVGREHRRALKELMNKKELVGDLFNNLRLTRQRLNNSARANSSTIDCSANGSSSTQGSSRAAKGVSDEVQSLSESLMRLAALCCPAATKQCQHPWQSAKQ